MMSKRTAEELERQLNSFSREERQEALAELVARGEKGSVDKEVANMHCHTFFSFNAYGYSPTALAWLARKRGYPLMGIVDFDVLDGVEEFLEACLTAGVRGSTAMETRAYLSEFGDREINSPGEPGVYYYMGIGFTRSIAPEAGAPILADLRSRSSNRNRAMVQRLNDYLAPVRVNYDRDVLPRTPAGNATERHMLAAYTQAVSEQAPDPVAFWSEKLNLAAELVAKQIGDAPTFQNTVRAKLMKRGGAGYVQPGAGSFPTVEAVNQLTTACEALPCATWLDGTSAGEQAIQEMLELLMSKGAVALNIIPDRNWNISDPEVKKKKLKYLYEVVELAGRLDLPLNIGTEMNTFGQKWIDDFDVPELAPVRQAFIDGAYFIYGHTLLQMALGQGYQSAWARKHLPARRARNDFYTRLGRRIEPGRESLDKLRKMPEDASPEEFLKLN